MLTGEVPFVLKDEHFEEDLAPDSVPEDLIETWESMTQCSVCNKTGCVPALPARTRH